MRERNVSDVAEAVRKANDRGVKVCLLIGAGVSYSAGIATAKGFVSLIRAEHPRAYERAKQDAGREPRYSECMDQLTDAEQRYLVQSQVDEAKINWAHIALALLESHGYADRILTVNFDPLASRACALFNRFPAVYDFAALQKDDGEHVSFLPSHVGGTSAVYHLHGQHTGFLLLNSDAKLEKQAKGLEPVLQEAMQNRLVIVCGYSGENDPLVEKIAGAGPFPNGLYWYCLDGETPAKNVRDTLLEPHTDSCLVKGPSADDFFMSLTRKLDIFPPAFLDKPFDHMVSVLDGLQPFLLDDDDGYDLLNVTRHRLRPVWLCPPEGCPSC